MDIMELGAVGELIGGVAVLVTLVYLAMQVRQNTYAVLSTSRQAMVGQLDQFTTMVLENPHVLPIFRVVTGDAPIRAVENPRGLFFLNMTSIF